MITRMINRIDWIKGKGVLIKLLGEDVFEAIKPYNPLLAGGAILDVLDSRTPKDWDLYVPTTEADALHDRLIDSYVDDGPHCKNYNMNGVLLQVVPVAEWSVVDATGASFASMVLKSFDFTVAQWGTYLCGDDVGDLNGLYFGPSTMDDWRAKDLVYVYHADMTVRIPTMLYRVPRYAEKGYKVTRELLEDLLSGILRSKPKMDDLDTGFRANNRLNSWHAGWELALDRAASYTSGGPSFDAPPFDVLAEPTAVPPQPEAPNPSPFEGIGWLTASGALGTIVHDRNLFRSESDED